MSGPLSVRLVDTASGRDQHVTQSCPSLSFTKTAPGGHASAQLRVNQPRRNWPTLGDSDRVYFYDQRTGATIFEGYCNYPGETFDESGSGFDLTAAGGASLAGDDRRALVYIDREGVNWLRNGPGSLPNTGTTWGPRASDGAQGMYVVFSQGQTVGTGGSGAMYYLFPTGVEFGAWGGTLVGGKSDGGWHARQAWTGGSGGYGDESPFTLSTSTVAFLNAVGDGIIGDNCNFSFAMWRSGGATTVADDLTWMHLSNVRILGRRMDKNGTLVTGWTGMVTADYVLASWVVDDLIGRMMPWVDANASSVATTATQIDQLTYRQAVTAATVLDDLSLWEPDYLWEVLHSTGGAGKHIFNYRAWPTTARYEISVKDGYSRPGSTDGLVNRIAVNWNDSAGNPQVTIVSATVADLGSRIRHADPITLPEGRGSATAATTIGTGVLNQLNLATTSANAAVRRPIPDLDTGRLVYPWEIEPGYMVRVRETGDLLRLTEVTYDWSASGTSEASLSLGVPMLSLDQRLARLDRMVTDPVGIT